MKSENPISLKVIHHRQNPIVTTYCNLCSSLRETGSVSHSTKELEALFFCVSRSSAIRKIDGTTATTELNIINTYIIY
jgi:hypothetical protein